MATKLIYPKLPYVRLGLWTFKIKIGYYTGIDYTDILLWQNSTSLHLEFKVDLNQTQIDWITALTQREDVQGPDTDLILVNNTYVIYDIWERRDIIAANAGFDFRIWWDSSGLFGPNVMDKIMFTPVGPGGSTKLLTNTNKRDLVNAIEENDGWV